MTQRLEDLLNEIAYPDSINTDKAITTTSTITASNISTLTTGSAGAFTVNGALTVTGGASLTGTVTVTAAAAGLTFGASGPTIQVGSNPNSGVQGPTGISATTGSLFINSTPTGPSNRLFVNAGATAWASVTVAA